MAWLKRRAKKARAAAAAAGGTSPSHEEAPEAPHTVVHGGAVSHEGEEEDEEAEEENGWAEVSGPPLRKPPLAERPASADGQPKPVSREGRGRNLMEQLARELGLKLPEKQVPAPPPRTEANPERPPRPASRPLIPEDPEPTTAPVRFQATPPPGEAAKIPPAVSRLGLQLRERGKLRDAIVFQEILNAPVSKRRR